MSKLTALASLLTSETLCMSVATPPQVSRTRSYIGASNTLELTPCYELPGTLITCGSHCYPNCDTHSSGSHPATFDFNHYIVIPEARTCYIDTLDYGRFDAFLSKDSRLSIKVDTYVAQDGVCVLDESGVTLPQGALGGDAYC